MEHVIDIETDGLFLAVHRGFLTVSAAGEEKGRIPLDDIGALIVHAHGTTWSNTVFVRLSERAVPVVICGANHAPVACVWPMEGHYQQGARMRAQIGASKPLTKQIWRQIVAAKIRMQGAICAAGLHPTIGVFHANRANAFALSDDLMEPYRPLVDRIVFDLASAGQVELTSDAKRRLAAIATLDLDNGDGSVSPLSIQVQRLVHSVAVSFETGRVEIALPGKPASQVLSRVMDEA